MCDIKQMLLSKMGIRLKGHSLCNQGNRSSGSLNFYLNLYSSIMNFVVVVQLECVVRLLHRMLPLC